MRASARDLFRVGVEEAPREIAQDRVAGCEFLAQRTDEAVEPPGRSWERLGGRHGCRGNLEVEGVLDHLLCLTPPGCEPGAVLRGETSVGVVA